MLQNEQQVSEESSAIAIELNDSDKKLKQQRSQRLSTSPDKFILIASATQASKQRVRSSLKETKSNREIQFREQFMQRMMTTPAKKQQNNTSLRSILDGSIRQRRGTGILPQKTGRISANLTVIEQSEPTLLSFRNITQSE